MNHIHILDEYYSLIDVGKQENKCIKCDLYGNHCSDDQCHLCDAFEYTFCLDNIVFKKLKIKE